MTEDAATVLEDWVQTVANLPAEIQHVLEEIQAKDKITQECRSQIAGRDLSIQKFLKANGCGQPNPKEEAYCATVMSSFVKAQALQDEKVALSERAATLLDRQIKRLDIKIRDLQNEGAIQPDPQLPSLLQNLGQPRLAAGMAPAPNGIPQALNPAQAAGLANAPLQRLVQPASHRQPSPLSQASAINGTANASRSPSVDNAKRRRLNPGPLNAPATASSLRQSSLGPGTPKDGTTTDASARDGVSPAPSSKASKKGNLKGAAAGAAGGTAGAAAADGAAAANGLAMPQRVSHLNPTVSGNKKGGAGSGAAGASAAAGTPSRTGDGGAVTAAAAGGTSGGNAVSSSNLKAHLGAAGRTNKQRSQSPASSAAGSVKSGRGGRSSALKRQQLAKAAADPNAKGVTVDADGDVNMRGTTPTITKKGKKAAKAAAAAAAAQRLAKHGHRSTKSRSVEIKDKKTKFGKNKKSLRKSASGSKAGSENEEEEESGAEGSEEEAAGSENGSDAEVEDDEEESGSGDGSDDENEDNDEEDDDEEAEDDEKPKTKAGRKATGRTSKVASRAASSAAEVEASDAEEGDGDDEEEEDGEDDEEESEEDGDEEENESGEEEEEDEGDDVDAGEGAAGMDVDIDVNVHVLDADDPDPDADDPDPDADEEEAERDDRKYCSCQSVSYGNMVACDNEDCPFEWFHWNCVGVTSEPKGKWFCPDCRKKR